MDIYGIMNQEAEDAGLHFQIVREYKVKNIPQELRKQALLDHFIERDIEIEILEMNHCGEAFISFKDEGDIARASNNFLIKGRRLCFKPNKHDKLNDKPPDKFISKDECVCSMDTNDDTKKRRTIKIFSLPETWKTSELLIFFESRKDLRPLTINTTDICSHKNSVFLTFKGEEEVSRIMDNTPIRFHGRIIDIKRVIDITPEGIWKGIWSSILKLIWRENEEQSEDKSQPASGADVQISLSSDNADENTTSSKPFALSDPTSGKSYGLKHKKTSSGCTTFHFDGKDKVSAMLIEESIRSGSITLFLRSLCTSGVPSEKQQNIKVMLGISPNRNISGSIADPNSIVKRFISERMPVLLEELNPRALLEYLEKDPSKYNVEGVRDAMQRRPFDRMYHVFVLLKENLEGVCDDTMSDILQNSEQKYVHKIWIQFIKGTEIRLENQTKGNLKTDVLDEPVVLTTLKFSTDVSSTSEAKLHHWRELKKNKPYQKEPFSSKVKLPEIEKFQWRCEMCLRTNKATDNKCSDCFHSRQYSIFGEMSVEPWECSWCDTDNNETAVHCRGCFRHKEQVYDVLQSVHLFFSIPSSNVIAQSEARSSRVTVRFEASRELLTVYNFITGTYVRNLGGFIIVSDDRTDRESAIGSRKLFSIGGSHKVSSTDKFQDINERFLQDLPGRYICCTGKGEDQDKYAVIYDETGERQSYRVVVVSHRRIEMYNYDELREALRSGWKLVDVISETYWSLRDRFIFEKPLHGKCEGETYEDLLYVDMEISNDRGSVAVQSSIQRVLDRMYATGWELVSICNTKYSLRFHSNEYRLYFKRMQKATQTK